MKKIILFFVLPLLILLSSCKTVEDLKGKVAGMQTKNLKKKMPDGSTIYYNINLTPTAAWGCKQVGEILAYDWNLIKTQAQFHFSGFGDAYDLLMTKGIAYLTQNHLTADYTNLEIPHTETFSFSDTENVTNTFNLDSKKAMVSSTGRCNTQSFNINVRGDRNGTNGTTRVISNPKIRTMEKMEIRAIAQ
ncbi:MAG: hypothetical protein ACNA7Y_02260 [Gammaproteobacteria bacterium]